MPPKTTYEYDEREDRLPKWARDLLLSLRRTIEQQERGLQARDAFPDSDVYTTDWRVGDRLNLPPGARVRFTFGPDFMDYFDVRRNGDRLEIHGGRAFVVHPSSTNRASVSLKEPGEW